LLVDIEYIAEQPMARFHSAQIASIVMSAAFVVASWLPTATVPLA